MDNRVISDSADITGSAGFGDSDPEFLRPHQRPLRLATYLLPKNGGLIKDSILLSYTKGQYYSGQRQGD